MSAASVREELGQPHEVVRTTGGEQWVFVTVDRRVSVNWVLLTKRTSCQFARTTRVVTLKEARVTKVEEKTSTWTATEEDCGN